MIKKSSEFYRSVCDNYGLELKEFIFLLFLALAFLIVTITLFIRSAPPRTLNIVSGTEGSSFHIKSLKYKEFIEKQGVRVTIFPSTGSVENLKLVSDPANKIDLAFTVSGIESEEINFKSLRTLGAIGHQPLFLFYRGTELSDLNELTHKRVAVGPTNSGTNTITTKILKKHQLLDGKNISFLSITANESLGKLRSSSIDAAFIMKESISSEDFIDFTHSKDIKIFNFKKHEAAYLRLFDFMDRFTVPQGAFDLAQNLPREEITLIGPMIELVARHDLHPALSDLILEAASHIHSHSEMFQNKGEFPKAVEQNIELSSEAIRYYKSGKTILFRHLPFWLASLISRIFFVLLPMIVLFIPLVKFIPWFFRWKNQMKLRKLYLALFKIESHYKREKTTESDDDLKKKFDLIDVSIKKLKIHPAFADQFYQLRKHVDYVRRIVYK